jgi:hypothetical protein
MSTGAERVVGYREISESLARSRKVLHADSTDPMRGCLSAFSLKHLGTWSRKPQKLSTCIITMQDQHLQQHAETLRRAVTDTTHHHHRPLLCDQH